MSPLVAFTIAVIFAGTPAAIGAAVFLWQLFDEDRRTANDPARIRLSLVLAVFVTAAAAAGVLLAIPSAFYILGIDGAARRAAGQLVLVAIDILLLGPVAIALYLRWLRHRGPES